MANTVIQLKYSSVTGIPPSLNVAEPAYSNVTNKLFINDGTSVVAIGGKFYTGIIDAATSANTPNTHVMRDLSGNFAANIITVAGLTSTGPVTENGYDLFIFANNAYNQANLALTAGGTIAGGYANAAYGQANAAFGFANTSNTYSYGVDAQQNTNIISAATYANGAFGAANSASSYANSGYTLANTVNLNANAGSSYANGAFGAANSASSYANSAFATANAEVKGVTAGVYANAAFALANTDATSVAAASSYANSAFSTANGKFSSGGGTVSGDVAITGNLTITGGTTYANTTTVLLGDNIITLNAQLPISAQPSANAGFEIERGAQPNSSILWIESQSRWAANTGNNAFYLGSLSGEVYANAAYGQANTATTNAGAGSTYANAAYGAANSASLYANAGYTQANTATVNAAAGSSFANSAYTQANTATTNAATADQKGVSAGVYGNAAFALANTTPTVGSYANAAYTQANTATVNAAAASSYGNSAYTLANTVNLNANAGSSYANGAFGAANSASSYANAAFAKANTDFTTITGVAGVYGSPSVIPVITYEANGRISLITNNTISIAASQITSGTLGVARGGTGNTAFNANYVLLGNGTNAIAQTGSSTEGHVLTINSAGVPTFSYLSGGTF